MSTRPRPGRRRLSVRGLRLSLRSLPLKRSSSCLRRWRMGKMVTKEATKQERVQELEAKAEEISQEVDELDSQLGDARSQIARAQERFAELDGERKRLAPRTFQGDDKAKLELEAL